MAHNLDSGNRFSNRTFYRIAYEDGSSPTTEYTFPELNHASDIWISATDIPNNTTISLFAVSFDGAEAPLKDVDGNDITFDSSGGYVAVRDNPFKIKFTSTPGLRADGRVTIEFSGIVN